MWLYDKWIYNQNNKNKQTYLIIYSLWLKFYILFQKYIFEGLDIRKHSHLECSWDLGQLVPSQSPEATLGYIWPSLGIPQQERYTVALGNKTWSDYVFIDSTLLRPNSSSINSSDFFLIRFETNLSEQSSHFFYSCSLWDLICGAYCVK